MQRIQAIDEQMHAELEHYDGTERCESHLRLRPVPRGPRTCAPSTPSGT
jgi:hypothetical protein